MMQEQKRRIKDLELVMVKKKKKASMARWSWSFRTRGILHRHRWRRTRGHWFRGYYWPCSRWCRRGVSTWRTRSTTFLDSTWWDEMLPSFCYSIWNTVRKSSKLSCLQCTTSNQERCSLWIAHPQLSGKSFPWMLELTNGKPFQTTKSLTSSWSLTTDWSSIPC